MVNLTVTIPEDLRKELQNHNEVNWSAVIRRSLKQHLQKLQIAEAIASKSRLTKKDVKELDDMIKKGVAENHLIK